jgi:flagellar basal-body rod modification protein FlgD
MSSIISSFLASDSQPAPGATNKATSTTDGLANKDVFMQLLVAQLKNQNPMNPADGTQFLTQLAQFSELEQVTVVRQDLEAIRSSLTTQTATQTA